MDRSTSRSSPDQSARTDTCWTAQRPAEVVVERSVRVDIPCDPTQIDHTGLPWTFLDEAAHLERIVEGAIVITGDAEDPMFARVASLTERPTGVKVHLEILPGDPLE
jgi:hypothetical protein